VLAKIHSLLRIKLDRLQPLRLLLRVNLDRLANS
jgi:hypothetical protein